MKHFVVKNQVRKVLQTDKADTRRIYHHVVLHAHNQRISYGIQHKAEYKQTCGSQHQVRHGLLVDNLLFYSILTHFIPFLSNRTDYL